MQSLILACYLLVQLRDDGSGKRIKYRGQRRLGSSIHLMLVISNPATNKIMNRQYSCGF
jgi:hypothetical protein